MPTEEVFTTPHKDRVEGRVTSTKPLSHQGTMIEGISVRFEAGKIVEAHAARGEQVLQRMIETDEGARRLGEVSLVPHSSPIASSGLLFMNTLFDENAACHIALGQAYSTCLKDGDRLTPEAIGGARREHQPDSRRLDDRIESHRRGRHQRSGRFGAGDARRRVGLVLIGS